MKINITWTILDHIDVDDNATAREVEQAIQDQAFWLEIDKIVDDTEWEIEEEG